MRRRSIQTEQENEKVLQNSLIEKEGRIAKLVDSEGWQEAKQLLSKKLANIDSISTLMVGKLPDVQLLHEISLRFEAIRLLQEWVADVEGTAAKHEVDVESLKEVKEDDYTRRL